MRGHFIKKYTFLFLDAILFLNFKIIFTFGSECQFKVTNGSNKKSKKFFGWVQKRVEPGVILGPWFHPMN